MGSFWSSLVGKNGVESDVLLHVNTKRGESDYNISSTVKKSVVRDDSGLKVKKPRSDSYVQRYDFNLGKGGSSAKLATFDPEGYTGEDHEKVANTKYNKDIDVNKQAPCFITEKDKDALVRGKDSESTAILRYKDNEEIKYVLLPSEINDKGELKVMGKKFATVTKEQENITAVKIDRASGISKANQSIER